MSPPSVDGSQTVAFFGSFAHFLKMGSKPDRTTKTQFATAKSPDRVAKSADGDTSYATFPQSWRRRRRRGVGRRWMEPGCGPGPGPTRTRSRQRRGRVVSSTRQRSVVERVAAFERGGGSDRAVGPRLGGQTSNSSDASSRSAELAPARSAGRGGGTAAEANRLKADLQHAQGALISATF